MNKIMPYNIYNLAKRFLNNNYFAYESEYQSFFTLGNQITLKLFSKNIQIIDNQKTLTIDRKLSAIEDLRFYINKYMQKNRRIFGWINFEFCLETLNIKLNNENYLLAVFFIPESEIHFINNNFHIYGNNNYLNEIKYILNNKNYNNETQNLNYQIKYQNDENYKNNVAKAIDDIKSNKYDKIILSRKVIIPFEVDFPQTYINGRLSNNPKRSFIFKLNNFNCLGFSPELVIKTYENNKILTEPLAGTRAVSKNINKNKIIINELYKDTKEIFEHAISVKLSYEEINKVSKNSTITNFMSVKQRGPVQHLASTVEGILDNDKDYFDALKILFPSVTATGIPKKESITSMLKLDEMPRELYSGGIGYIDIDNSFELTLVLRSIFKNEKETFLRAGAGIVQDSKPQRELEETNEKLSSILPYIVKK